MKINEIYIQLALVYRLSLNTMMKLMKKSIEEIYEILVQGNYYHPLKFLFECDTIGEDSNTRKQKELKAKEFLLSYKKGDINKKRELILTLIDIDKKYKEVVRKGKLGERLNKEDYNTLTLYRIKYAISQNDIMANIKKQGCLLSHHEIKIEDETIRNQLDRLNSYTMERITNSNRTQKYNFGH